VIGHLYYKPGQGHQLHAMECLAAGLQEHGVATIISPYWDLTENVDFVVCWGDKVPANIRLPRLILEAGYINGQSGEYVLDRLRFVSAGWNGLHGRADSGPLDCPPDRWNALDEPILPWRADDGEYVLICDQHPGDQCSGPRKWWKPIADDLAHFRVVYRPHPLFAPNQRPLSEALEGAGLVVTWSSTCAIRSVLDGIPTIALDRGSMAYDVASQSIDDEVYLGPREQWAYNLAYRQFTHTELADGIAWEVLKNGIATDNRTSERTGHDDGGETTPAG